MATPTDFTLVCNTSFSIVVELKNSLGVAIDLSSYDIADFYAQISEGSKKPKLVDFSVEYVTDGSEGKVRFSLVPAQTDSLSSEKTYGYDAFWTVSATVRHRILYGEITVEDNISRP
jgi:hypothetical protein